MTDLVDYGYQPRYGRGLCQGGLAAGNAVVAPSILRLVQSSTPNLESGLKLVFLIGAVTMMTALLMIITIPGISMEAEITEKKRDIHTSSSDRSINSLSKRKSHS